MKKVQSILLFLTGIFTIPHVNAQTGTHSKLAFLIRPGISGREMTLPPVNPLLMTQAGAASTCPTIGVSKPLLTLRQTGNETVAISLMELAGFEKIFLLKTR